MGETASERGPQARVIERRFAAIVEASEDAIAVFDVDGRITFVNPAAERLFGVGRVRMLGRRYDDPAFGLVRPAGRRGGTRFGGPFERALRSRRPVGPATLGLARADGAQLTVAAHITPLIGTDGTVVELVASLRDVTAEVNLAAEREARLEESRRVARLLAEESSPQDAARGLLAEFARAWPVVSATLYAVEGGAARLVAEWTAPGLKLDKPAWIGPEDLGRLLEPVRAGRPVRRAFERRVTEAATHAAMAAAGARSDLLVPLVDGRLGVLVAADTRAMISLSRSEERDLAEFGRLAAAVVRRARRHASADLEEARRQVGELLAAPERLQPLFQPIVQLDRHRVVGYEALARFDPEASPPGPWFAAAARAGLMEELQALAIARARQVAGEARLPSGAFLSVNVSPSLLGSPKVAAALDGGSLRRLVIELSEEEPVRDYQVLRVAMAPYRARGARLAIDDAGAGYASLRHIVEMRPDYVKLDAELIIGLRDDDGRQALVRALQTFAGEVGVTLVAEGVEHLEDLELLARDRAPLLVQGYALNHPGPPWPGIASEALAVLRSPKVAQPGGRVSSGRRSVD